MTFVADASVAAAWVLPDEEAAIADLALERLGEETTAGARHRAAWRCGGGWTPRRWPNEQHIGIKATRVGAEIVAQR